MMFNKEIIYKNDIVLVSLRHFQNYKADVIHRYSRQEAIHLTKIGEIPSLGELQLIFIFKLNFGVKYLINQRI